MRELRANRRFPRDRPHPRSTRQSQCFVVHFPYPADRARIVSATSWQSSMHPPPQSPRPDSALGRPQ
eukprot:scaffold3823_cov195-Amphora_coffeaeformis.AAC.32